MERKWTPGPWVAGPRYRSIISDNPTGYEDEDSIEAYGGHLVCESVKWDANAHLIAAAPDLYEALKRAAMWIEAGNDRTGPVLRQCYAALDKARGEA